MGVAERSAETDEDRADALFHALADRTRRDILRRVLVGEHSVTALAAKYDMSFASVQKHVAVLERAGLLTKRRRGREQLAHGEVEAVRSVASMLVELEDLWRGRIARIEELIAADPVGHPQPVTPRPTDRPGDDPRNDQERPPCPSPTSPTTSTPAP